jgi:hypothetical protein
LVKGTLACHQAGMSGPGATLLSVLMLVAFALAAGGLWMIARGGETRRGVLMLVAAAVALANVLIWMV